MPQPWRASWGTREVGDFQVDVVHNAPAHIVQGHIEDLFADSLSDDLVLLHFSGHGLKSDSGELFFAARNTRPDRLGSTAVPADFVQRCMRSSRARSVVLFLDCCYGGAFGEGVAVRAAGVRQRPGELPGGTTWWRARTSGHHCVQRDGVRLRRQQPCRRAPAAAVGLHRGTRGRAGQRGSPIATRTDWSRSTSLRLVYDQVRERNPKQTRVVTWSCRVSST